MLLLRSVSKTKKSPAEFKQDTRFTPKVGCKLAVVVLLLAVAGGVVVAAVAVVVDGLFLPLLQYSFLSLAPAPPPLFKFFCAKM